MKAADKKKLKEAIYFLKVEELKQLIVQLNLGKPTGRKNDLIVTILSHFKIKAQDHTVLGDYKLPNKHKANVTSETHIIPGKYTNGKKSREIFKELIGEHFHFTVYGMEWIKKCWEAEIYPSYNEFSQFWESEYHRRKSGSDFKSLSTNRRVVFFRANKGLGKVELEAKWELERARNVAIVKNILHGS